MSFPPNSVIEDRSVKVFPNTRLKELDRETGVGQREGGKLEADAFFWALTLGFVAGYYCTIEEFRQEDIDTAGGTLSYASFHGWFTDDLCDFLRAALMDALAEVESEEDRL